MKKYFISFLFPLSALFIFVSPAFAHVVVTPHTVGIAASQVFDMSVPTEKDTPTVGIKLLIPEGVSDVIPNVKPGWTINLVKKGDNITEIDWTGGTIPVEQRDDFFFKAHVPGNQTTLAWKAYQTYQDGSVVAWDHKPGANSESESGPLPYSTTQVINDLVPTPAPVVSQTNSSLPLIFSLVSLALSATALAIAQKRR